MHPWVVSRSPGRNKSKRKRSGSPKMTLRGNCLHHHHKTQLPLPPPCPLQPPLLEKSRDKRPRDPSKDPNPQWRPSKASRSPLPFSLRSESKRVANIHTIFEAALSQNRSSSEWVYNCLKVFFPCKSVEQLVYFSNVLTQDVRIHCIATINWLGVWLHQVDMTMHYNEGRANSPCSDDHKLGTLLDFFLMPENTGVGLKHVIDWVVAENVDALEVRLVKSKKLLKEASKTQTRLLTHLAKQKMTLQKTHLSRKVCDETSKVLSQTTQQLDRARTTVTMHTADIIHIESLLKDCESIKEESSSSGENSALVRRPPSSQPTGTGRRRST